MGAKEDFLRIYANLPLALRKEIILILDEEPITWNAAYIEVKNNTKKAQPILDKLKEVKFI